MGVDYVALYDAAIILPAKQSVVAYVAAVVRSNRGRYGTLGIPWYALGIIHGLESGFNFDCHLYNGDPLSARTVNKPNGRPVVGDPPFTWAESAHEAVQRAWKPEQWAGPADALAFFEHWNGLGYQAHLVNSPYLWSMTNLYSSGKFVADGKFDSKAVSDQVGAAAALKALALSLSDFGQYT